MWQRWPQPRHPTRPAGFTLLELILVLAVLAIAAAMAAPSLRQFGRGRGAGDCAAQIVALTHYARTQAVTDGAVYRLNLDPASGTFWLTVQRAGFFESLGNEFGRVFTAPEGVTMECDLPPQPDGLYVEFWPTGRTQPAVIRLTDTSNRVTEVACYYPTERFRVVNSGG